LTVDHLLMSYLQIMSYSQLARRYATKAVKVTLVENITLKYAICRRDF